MDVYELILHKGYVGALLYANSIDSTNYRLASEIDLAVASLRGGMKRTAQFMAPRIVDPGQYRTYTSPVAPVAPKQPTPSKDWWSVPPVLLMVTVVAPKSLNGSSHAVKISLHASLPCK